MQQPSAFSVMLADVLFVKATEKVPDKQQSRAQVDFTVVINYSLAREVNNPNALEITKRWLCPSRGFGRSPGRS